MDDADIAGDLDENLRPGLLDACHREDRGRASSAAQTSRGTVGRAVTAAPMPLKPRFVSGPIVRRSCAFCVAPGMRSGSLEAGPAPEINGA